MGISGLLPILKSIARPRHLREYKGKAVAVDGALLKQLEQGVKGGEPEPHGNQELQPKTCPLCRDNLGRQEPRLAAPP